VTIGRQTRLYHAFVTTAPAALDAPSTLTLYAGPLKDVVGFAVDNVPLDATKPATPSRLVLIDTAELGWQRALPIASASTHTCRSGVGRPQHLAAVAVAATEDPNRGNARINAYDFITTTSRERAGVQTVTTITIQILRTKALSPRQARRCGDPLHRRGTRRAEARWVRRLEERETAMGKTSRFRQGSSESTASEAASRFSAGSPSGLRRCGSRLSYDVRTPSRHCKR
jgi:hypothetical protein